ncbi:MAG: CPBP family glutamic-type intramembrane protease [Bacteroidia bacterium]|nr:CPBP family glutamic-type intramembrane protease [Bacteroidia bacterium]MDW8015656.1 CPBP family glutamic-type intramembrane protease [Bacteroidia bacterium]
MIRAYWKASLSPAYNFFLSLVLLIGYEGIFRLTGGSLSERNLIDQWLSRLVGWAAPHEWVISLSVILLGLAYVYGIRRERIEMTEWVFLIMIGEAAAWALLLYQGLPLLTTRLGGSPPFTQLDWLSSDLWRSIAQCMGAGFYEELFFRVLLVEALLLLVTGFRPRTATAFQQMAVWIFSAALFSAAHFIYESPSTYAFLYRFIFGLFMSGLYILRGFGISAWTHALYDIYVLL